MYSVAGSSAPAATAAGTCSRATVIGSAMASTMLRPRLMNASCSDCRSWSIQKKVTSTMVTAITVFE